MVLPRGESRMNWKWIIAVALGMALGLTIAPFESRTVSASTAPVNAHFQIQDATVNEPGANGEELVIHEVFLLDTEGGRVWKFKPLQIAHQADGSTQAFPEEFVSVPVEAAK